MKQEDVSTRNAEFWNELCGTHLAKHLGIHDASPESLKKFDDWFFDFYPYVFDHIPFKTLQGKAVLEVGLGYGSVSQKLAESGADYRGLDIAAGPVGMVNHRLREAQIPGQAVQGNLLKPPFEPASFDAIVTIGCLHHTGNMPLAIQRCWELLRPGGQLICMVYHAYSYRRFRMAPLTTLKYMAREAVGYRGVLGISDAGERAVYDTNSEGTSAPHTDWISDRSLKALCGRFAKYSSALENMDPGFPFARMPRSELLKSRWAKILGLDLYATATK